MHRKLRGGERARRPAVLDRRLERRELLADAADHVLGELRRDDLALDEEHPSAAGEANVIRERERRHHPRLDPGRRRARRVKPSAGYRSAYRWHISIVSPGR
jgi:hypothetical protein